MNNKKLPSSSSGQKVQSFLERLSTLPSIVAKPSAGRLLFALDATASREPSWRTARQLQREMFDVAGSLGGLDLQLCYYRGMDEFHASPWLSSAEALKAQMDAVECRSGYTQITRVLAHALRETKRFKVAALVLIADCMEENSDTLYSQAGELALLGVRAFIFQEGDDPAAERTFRQVARLTRGAYSRFDAGSADQLRQLLGAVAAYAAGGLGALDAYSLKHGGAARQLTHQVKRT